MSPAASQGPAVVSARPKYLKAVLAALLVLAAAAVYREAPTLQFVGYDDTRYIVDNPYLAEPLSLRTFSWALTADSYNDSFYADYYQPVTLVSRIFDAALFGMRPAMHHVMNVIYHASNAVLVFLLFSLMTGKPGRSFFLALLFAVHPYQVEAAAWVTARKDLAASFFGFLALLAYARRRKKNLPGHGGWFYVFYLASLAAKPVFAPLPFALYVLDFWPLRTQESLGPRREVLAARLLMLLPPAGLALLDAIRRPEALGHLPWGVQAANVLVAYFEGVRLFFVPLRLGIAPSWYDYPSASSLASAAFFLAGVSLAAFAARKAGHAAAGWLWYLIFLLPVSGFMAFSDRFMYVPLLGLGIMVIWTVAAWAEKSRVLSALACAAGCAACFFYGTLSSAQIRTWKDTESLFRQALARDPENDHGQMLLGAWLAGEGRTEEGLEHLSKAIALNPRNTTAYARTGSLLAKEGRMDEAKPYFDEILRRDPADADLQTNLGFYFLLAGDKDAAAAHYRRALEINPDVGPASLGLGSALQSQGKSAEALPYLQRAAALMPAAPEAYRDWGAALIGLKQFGQAAAVLNKGLQLDRTNPVLYSNLGIALSSLGRFRESQRAFSQAIRLDPMNAQYHYNLGLAFARAGDLRAAGLYFSQALRIDPAHAGAAAGLKEVERLKAAAPEAKTP
ncbi:MAG TPA: tetratricopeptide repeat protein [Verrucomicrobiae bacterium]|jgi:tetratricopeptide (TPR) repeat protein|nr:tetratricopeptide repeat protein [Verrucomicrobiae bacterium]